MTYVLMRILESAPRRYDLGICLLSLGRLARAYDRLANRIEPGQHVLDLGCGTGVLTLRAAPRGAKTGFRTGWPRAGNRPTRVDASHGGSTSTVRGSADRGVLAFRQPGAWI